MKTGTKIVFFREKVIHSRSADVTPHQKILVEVPAVYIAESDAWCEICHEPKYGHDRRGRKHAFVPQTLDTIEINFPDEGKEIRHHVPQGNTVNSWKKEKS